jgi:peroxiredoxin
LSRIKPRQRVPELTLSTVDGGTYDLRASDPRHFSMVVFYRGLHCPVCKKYLGELEAKLAHFEALGVKPVAISTDGRDRAQRAVKEWGLAKLPVAYGLPVDGARKWGLYISHAIREGEPALFSEPGLFLVRPDLTLQYAAINSGARGRPGIADMLGAVQFMIENNAPPRGEA